MADKKKYDGAEGEPQHTNGGGADGSQPHGTNASQPQAESTERPQAEITERPQADSTEQVGDKAAFEDEQRERFDASVRAPKPEAEMSEEEKKAETKRQVDAAMLARRYAEGKNMIGGMPSVGDVVAENDAETKLMQEKPWLMAGSTKEALSNYNVTPQQYVSDIINYRRQKGEPISNDEWYEMMAATAGKDPTMTAKQEAQNKKVAAWQDAIRGIGDVINHFVQYGRAKNGSVTAPVQNTYDAERLARLRAADEQLKRQRYQDWAGMMMNQAKEQQQRELMEAKQRQEYAKWLREQNSPKAVLAREEQAYKAAKAKKELEGYDDKEELERQVKQSTIDKNNAAAEASRNGKVTTTKSKKEEKDPNAKYRYKAEYKGKTYYGNTYEQVYKDILVDTGEAENETKFKTDVQKANRFGIKLNERGR